MLACGSENRIVSETKRKKPDVNMSLNLSYTVPAEKDWECDCVCVSEDYVFAHELLSKERLVYDINFGLLQYRRD